MRRAAVVVAALATLTACGPSPSAAPSSSVPTGTSSVTTSGTASTSSAAVLAKPIVTRFGALKVGVGRAAVIPQQDGGQHVIIAGGLIVGDSTTNAAQIVDLATGQTLLLPPMPVPVHDTAGLQSPLGPLVIGGGNSSEQSVVQQFTQTKNGPNTGSWKVIGNLPSTRSDLAAAAVTPMTYGGKGYVLGGYDAVTPAVRTVLSTSNGVTWTSAGTLAVPVRYGAPAVSAGKIYLFGGEVSNLEQSVIQAYDPATGRTHIVGHLPMALGHMSAVAVGEKILVLGGRTDATSGAMTDQMWWFDPATATLTDAGRLPYPVADAALTVMGNNAFLIGGESPHPITTILRIAFTKE